MFYHECGWLGGVKKPRVPAQALSHLSGRPELQQNPLSRQLADRFGECGITFHERGAVAELEVGEVERGRHCCA